jgi:hypothetical protein
MHQVGSFWLGRGRLCCKLLSSAVVRSMDCTVVAHGVHCAIRVCGGLFCCSRAAFALCAHTWHMCGFGAM